MLSHASALFLLYAACFAIASPVHWQGERQPSQLQRTSERGQSSEALERAIKEHRQDAVARAIEGVDLNLALPAGRTPLALAVLGHDLAIVRTLLQSGANVNQPDAFGSADSPLLLAIKSGYLEMVEELLRSGADPNQRVGSRGEMTPLGVAALVESPGACLLLLEKGADIDAWNLWPTTPNEEPYQPGQRRGKTALMIAAYQGNIAAALMLVARGANVNLQNDQGLTAFDMTRLRPDPMKVIRDALKHPERHGPR